MKLNLRTKLIGSFVIILLLIVVVGLMGTYTSQTIRDRLDNIIERDVKSENILGDLGRTTGFIRANSLLHLLTSSVEDMNRYESEVSDLEGKINTDLDTLENIFKDQATLDKLAEFRTAWETYLRVWREQVVPLSRANRDEEVFTLARKSGAGGMAAREAMYKLSELHDANVAAANHGLKLANRDSSKSQYILLAVIFLAIILGLAFAIKQGSLISGHVNAVSRAAQLVAAGDLDQKVEVKTGDEIESMANSFNTMTLKLKSMVEELQSEITERRRAEEELKKHRDHLEELVEERTESLRENEQRLLKAEQVARMGFMDINLKTNEVYWSDEIYLLYGINPHEQKSSFELTKQLTHPDDLVFVMKEIDSAIQGISEFDIDHRILRFDGKILWVHEKAELIRDADGNPGCLLSTVVDITERKQAEEALKDAELRYRTVADFTYDWEYWINPDGSLNYISPSCEKITGYSREQFIKNTGLLDEIMLSNDMAIWKNHNHESAHLINAEREIQFRIKRKDGTIIWIEHACRPVFDDHGAFLGYRASNRDITERKQAEDQIRRDLKEKELLLAEVHHRVKNNLQVISGLLQLQENEIQTKEDALKGFAVSQDRILAMAKAYELLLQSEYMSEVSVGKYIESLAGQLKYNYDVHHKVKISYSLDELTISIEILDRLGLILNELITNAIKYAFEGRDKGNIYIELKEAEKHVVIKISDDGVGIPKEVKIHDPATLGLSIVDMITQQLQGTLKLERKNGTSFTLVFPKKINGN